MQKFRCCAVCSSADSQQAPNIDIGQLPLKTTISQLVNAQMRAMFISVSILAGPQYQSVYMRLLYCQDFRRSWCLIRANGARYIMIQEKEQLTCRLL